MQAARRTVDSRSTFVRVGVLPLASASLECRLQAPRAPLTTLPAERHLGLVTGLARRCVCASRNALCMGTLEAAREAGARGAASCKGRKTGSLVSGARGAASSKSCILQLIGSNANTDSVPTD